MHEREREKIELILHLWAKFGKSLNEDRERRARWRVKWGNI